MAMHKNEFIREVAKRTGFTQLEVRGVLAGITDAIGDALRDGDSVVLTGFGTFERRERSPRNGVNPQTMERITVRGGTVPGFTAPQGLRAKVRGEG